MSEEREDVVEHEEDARRARTESEADRAESERESETGHEERDGVIPEEAQRESFASPPEGAEPA